jgi:hypothetical protein
MPILLKNSTITNKSPNSIDVQYGPAAKDRTNWRANAGVGGAVTIPSGGSHTFPNTADIQLMSILETAPGLYGNSIFSSAWAELADTPASLDIQFSSDTTPAPRPTHLDIRLPNKVNYERVTVQAAKA